MGVGAGACPSSLRVIYEALTIPLLSCARKIFYFSDFIKLFIARTEKPKKPIKTLKISPKDNKNTQNTERKPEKAWCKEQILQSSTYTDVLTKGTQDRKIKSIKCSITMFCLAILQRCRGNTYLTSYHKYLFSCGIIKSTFFLNRCKAKMEASQEEISNLQLNEMYGLLLDSFLNIDGTKQMVITYGIVRSAIWK